MLTVTCSAFALSCGRMRAATAAIGTVAYLFAEDGLRRLPFFAAVRPWLVMTYETSWSRVFDPAPDWRWLADVYGPLALFDAVVLTVAAVVFSRRDFAR